LDNLCSDRDVVEEAKSHMFIGFGVVSRGAHDCKRSFDFATRDCKTCLDDPATTQSCGICRSRADVEG